MKLLTFRRQHEVDEAFTDGLLVNTASTQERGQLERHSQIGSQRREDAYCSNTSTTPSDGRRERHHRTAENARRRLERLIRAKEFPSGS